MFLWTSSVLLPRSFSPTRQFQSLKVTKHENLSPYDSTAMAWNKLNEMITSDFAGIYWDKLSPEKLGQIRILRELKHRIEQETGQTLPTGPSEKLPPTAGRKR